jgi:uncharacterized protein YndB with AHSA1/START domain
MMNPAPVIKEVLLNAPASKVWNAITDKKEMKQWYFDLAEFKPEVGFEFQFYGGDEKKQWLHLCKVTEAITGKKLTSSWKYDGYGGISYVAFELFPEGSKTRLKLTHSGLESFPVDEVPEFNRENFEAGWESIICTSLKDFFEKR